MIRRGVAVILLAAVAFSAGWQCGAHATAREDHSAFDVAELSWVIEDLQEQIVSLNEQLARAREIQQDKPSSGGE